MNVLYPTLTTTAQQSDGFAPGLNSEAFVLKEASKKIRQEEEGR